MLILADHQRRVFTVIESLKSLLLVVLDFLFESHLQGLSLIVSEFGKRPDGPCILEIDVFNRMIWSQMVDLDACFSFICALGVDRSAAGAVLGQLLRVPHP